MGIQFRPKTRFIIPGDRPRGVDRPYKGARLIIQGPRLPQMVRFYNALPATFVPILVGGMGGAPDAPQSKYYGVTPSDSGFFPIIEKRKPWER